MTIDRWNDHRLDDLAVEVSRQRALSENVARLAADMEAVAKDQKRIDKNLETLDTKMDTLQLANRWTPVQWAAIIGPALTALIGAAALVVTRSPG